MAQKETHVNGQAMAQMPKYRCHKEVWALKIERVDWGSESSGWLFPADKTFAPIEVSREWFAKHQPASGGYYVTYQDGYTSFSPADAFESGYTLIGERQVYAGRDRHVTGHPGEGKPQSIDLTSLL
jgi:hypothetical protein